FRYLDSSANYTGPVAFTAACGNALCAQSSYTGYYFNGPTLRSNTLEENIGQYRTYSGLELTARKRMSNHWMMTTSYVYNRERNYALTPDSWTNLDPHQSSAGRPARRVRRRTAQRPPRFQAHGDVSAAVRHHGLVELRRDVGQSVQSV